MRPNKYPKFDPKPKKRPKVHEFKSADKLPGAHVVCVESIEQEDEVYYNNQTNDLTTRITFGKKGVRGRRSRFPIAKREFHRLCQFLPRPSDLCSWFKVDEESLTNWAHRAFPDYTFKRISDLIGQLGSQYTFGLRRVMWEHAQKSPNAAMFLCKNYLGLREAPQDEGHNLQVETINYNFPQEKNGDRWRSPKETLDEPIELPPPVEIPAELVESVTSKANGGESGESTKPSPSRPPHD